MSKDKEIAKQDDSSIADARKTEDASASAKRADTNEEELEEGLEESMPRSDAPASTMRLGEDDK